MSRDYIYHHAAMNTEFTFRLVAAEKDTAQKAAFAAITLLDQLESKLSRYISGSDISQINHMQTGESLYISDLCYECLRVALAIGLESRGLFDITLGRQIEHLKSSSQDDQPELMGQLSLDPDKPAIHCLEAGREVDLGGIGKGFALDCIRKELEDWEIESGLLSSGASTHLAFGHKAWHICYDSGQAPYSLKNAAMSVSGIDIQGDHIVSPRPDQALLRQHLWVIHPNAAAADAWSTACFLMTDEELASCGEPIKILRG